MGWSIVEFFNRLNECGDRYELENQWFKKEVWGEKLQYMMNAWQLYKCANRSTLGMLLLGDTKIRKDKSLLANFGIASAGGLKDPEELKMLEKLKAERVKVGSTVEVLGSGSILNDQYWTPLLNDAFVIGGVHAQQDFHLAEDEADKYFVTHGRPPAGGSPPPSADADARRLWSGFFAAHPGLLWGEDYHGPRILSRELIGLKTFGYQPQFSTHGLFFTCKDPGTASHASFARYLDAVEAAGFRSRSRDTVLNAVCSFLFGCPWAKLSRT